MKAIFENYLRTHAQLTEEEITQISALAVSRKLRRNELLLRTGEVCRHKVFITGGMLRTYTIKEDGSEHIIQLSPELTWTLDAESYDQQQPSKYYISAVEPSEILLWAKPDFDRLLITLPPLKQYSERLISRNIYSGRQRLATALGGTPEEKYNEFVRSFPTYLARLPLRMIAAYLGISVKTLTRIRHAQLQRL